MLLIAGSRCGSQQNFGVYGWVITLDFYDYWSTCVANNKRAASTDLKRLLFEHPLVQYLMSRFTNNLSLRAQYVNVKIKSSRSSYFAKETNTHVFLMASLWLLEAISLRNSLSKSFQLFLPDIFIPPCDCKCFKREMYF